MSLLICSFAFTQKPLVTQFKGMVQTDRNHLDFYPHKPSIRDQVRVLIQSLALSHSAVEAIAVNREAQKLRICCMLSSLFPFLPSPPQVRTTQFQFIKLLLVCLIFYIHYCFHCFPLFQLFQTCSNLSRSFTKSNPQNCTELFHC